jgi:hypothetical protein
MRAKRRSKPTAANMTRAIIIFRNVLIPLEVALLRDSFSSEIISSISGGSQKDGVTDQPSRPRLSDSSPSCAPRRTSADHSKFYGHALVDLETLGYLHRCAKHHAP